MRSRIERSRYAQIALTYTKPLPMRIWAVTTLIGMLWHLVAAMILASDSSAQTAVEFFGGSMLFFGGMMAAWVGAMIAAHAKEQLADPRASLVPGFRTPHLVVAAAMFLVFVVAVAWGVACLSAVWPPGYLALVLVITTLLAWMAQLQTPAMFVLIAAVISPVFVADGRALLGDVLAADATGIGYALLAVSNAALVALWFRLARMHEEVPEYSRSVSPGLRLKVRMTGDPTFRRENAAGTSAVETFVRHAERLDDLPNIASAGFWPRVRHWRHVIGAGRLPILVALLLGIWTLVMQLTARVQDTGMGIAMIVAALVPGLMLAGTWPRRWYVLADESLRPVSRRRFILEQGAAMALEHATTWAWITATSFIAALLFAPWSRVFPQLMLVLPILAGAQVLIFGVLVWILRFRAGWLIIVPMLVVTFIGAAAMIAAGEVARHRDAVDALLLALLLAAGGTAIAFDAYRRWLTTEFD